VAYWELAPPPALRGLAECSWVSTPDPGPLVIDVLPDGCMDLVWTGGRLVVAGPDTAPHPARHEPGRPTVGLRFAPGALPHLLGVPAAVLRDQRVPLADLQPPAGPAGRGLSMAESRLGCDPPEPLGALTDVALALLAAADRASDPATRELAARIGTGAGVAATADALGCTTRTLHRRCLAEFGYGPSVLRRVLRFRRASALLHAGMAPAEVAAVAGYADQPHLSREVRALAGVAPGQLASGANRSTPLPSGSSTTA
jgi:AraC-like DNA-binding protein